MIPIALIKMIESYFLIVLPATISEELKILEILLQTFSNFFITSCVIVNFYFLLSTVLSPKYEVMFTVVQTIMPLYLTFFILMLHYRSTEEAGGNSG